MKAITLYNYIQEAKQAVLNAGFPEASNAFLHPVGWYEYDALVIAPNGITTSVAPKLFATQEATTKLCAVLATERGLKFEPIQGPPNDLSLLRGGWKYSKDAWLLKDENTGYLATAGLELDFWMHGYDARYALNHMVYDILEQMWISGFVSTPPDWNEIGTMGIYPVDDIGRVVPKKG